MGTSKTGLPVPDLGFLPNVPADMLTLATALDNVTVPSFTTTALRDAAVAAGATFGICFVAGTPYRLRAGVWTQLVDFNDQTAAIAAALAAAPKAVSLAAPALPTVTLGAGGGTLGMGSGITVSAVSYARLVRFSLDVVLSSASAFCTFAIQWNGAQVGNSTRGVTPQHAIHLEGFVAVAANASGSGAATINCGGAAGTYPAPNGSFTAQSWPM